MREPNLRVYTCNGAATLQARAEARERRARELEERAGAVDRELTAKLAELAAAVQVRPAGS